MSQCGFNHSPTCPTEGGITASLRRELSELRAAHSQTIQQLDEKTVRFKIAEAKLEQTIQAAEKLAEALKVMPLGIIGWPEGVSKRTLEMRDAALAQYADLRSGK